MTIADGVERYDLRGLKCPLPVMRTTRRMTTMKPGERLVVETTDPLAVIDIPAFCNDNGHRLVESRSIQGGHEFLIEKGG